MTSPQPSAPWWSDVGDLLDEPVADVAADQRARTEAALARLDALNDREACDAWMDSHSAADIYPHTEE